MKHSYRFIQRHCSLLALLFGVLMIGCADDNPSSPNNDDNPTTAPKVGDILYWKSYQHDSNGVKTPGSDWLYSAEVKEVGVSFGGKSNLHKFFSDGDTVFIKYEPNGDIWFTRIDPNQPDQITLWGLYPCGSKKNREETIDTSVTDVSTGKIRRAIGNYRFTYDGMENIKIGNETFSTVRIKLDSDYSLTLDNQFESRTTTIATLHYAPDLGYFVRQESVASYYLNPVTGFRVRSTQMVTSYSKK